MRWSELFIPTLREEPAGSGAGERRLIRAGYLRSAGRLVLGQRVIGKMEAMAREEMKSAGGQEISLDGDFRESSLAIARHDLRSYKQLPQVWFQMAGARFQSCRFDTKPAHHAALYRRILDRCGVDYVALQDALAALSPDGGELLTRGSDYESNLQRARSVAKPPAVADPEGDLAPEEFHTPGKKTIAEVTTFTGLPETSQMKSLVMVADGAPFLILVRGDHTLNEEKFKAQLGVRQARPATADEIRQWFGADPGSLGPVGVTNLRVLADEALRGRRNMICGANRNDYHLRNVTPGEDFQAEFFDLRMALEGDASILDGAPLRIERGFTLARFEDSTPRDLHISNESGVEVAPHFSIGELFFDRILIAAAEQMSDADGLAFPPSMAPFDLVITPVNFKDAAQRDAAVSMHAELARAGLDPLLDDREERPGVKFKDADLIGIPFRITIGKKLAQGVVEVADRRARCSQDLPLDRVAAFLLEQVRL